MEYLQNCFFFNKKRHLQSSLEYSKLACFSS